MGLSVWLSGLLIWKIFFVFVLSLIIPSRFKSFLWAHLHFFSYERPFSFCTLIQSCTAPHKKNSHPFLFFFFLFLNSTNEWLHCKEKIHILLGPHSTRLPIHTSLNPVSNAQVSVYLTIHITKLQLQTTFSKPLYIPHSACIHRDPGRWKSWCLHCLWPVR